MFDIMGISFSFDLGIFNYLTTFIGDFLGVLVKRTIFACDRQSHF